MAHNIYAPSAAALLMQQQKQAKKRFANKIAITGLAFTAMHLWFAQLVDWGLSYFGVHAGIWGPFLLMLALSGVITGSVRAGMLQTVQDTRE